MLMNVSIENDYEFILTSKFKSDSMDLRFSQYKQIKVEKRNLFTALIKSSHEKSN